MKTMQREANGGGGRTARCTAQRAALGTGCWLVWGLAVCALGRGAEPTATATAPIDFSSQIRPILAAHCWSCHGPDEGARSGELRLDVREAATAARGDQGPAIVPRQPDQSPLVARIESADESQRMPPVDAKRPLNDDQKRLLRRWIAEGAPFARHWSFQPPQRPALPQLDANLAAGVRQPLDLFVRQKLPALGLHAAPEAARETLLRRVTLDLTGLPPSLDEQDAFLADDGPDAYDRVVDRLLSSPRYGERMAMQWLDLARYADTNGYNNDEHRTMWPWRDWVIRAFRRHMPYDQFIVEQLAGDLLPDATLDQRVATGFNRNHVLTTEGGIIDEEYRVEYVADRIHTTATVFLGLSLQCARCHEHKYDPISQREYYQFFAYFNGLPDRGVGYNKEGSAAPAVRVPSDDQTAAIAALERRLAELQVQRAARAESADQRVATWETRLTADDRRQIETGDALAHLAFDETGGDTAADRIDPRRMGKVHGKATWAAGHQAGALEFDGSTFVELTGLGDFDATERFSLAVWVFTTASDAQGIVSKMDEGAAHRGYDLLLEQGRVVTHLIDRWPDNAIKLVARQPLPQNEWHHVLVSYDGSRKAAGVRIYVDGQPIEADIQADTLTGTLRTDKPLHVGRRQQSLPFRGRLDDVQLFSATLSAADAARLADGRPVARIADILAITPAERTAEQRDELRQFYLKRFDAEYAALNREIEALPGRRDAIVRDVPQVMVMEESGERRAARVLRRGQYDQPGEEVAPGVPTALSPLPSNAPPNRLGLAHWLVAPNHPLTARVAVNRWWEMFLGTGLVETVEDFGTTGAPPTHPQLLDWLAVELQARGWDLQIVQRQIVGSATYRQSSATSADDRGRDPRNQYLARAPRFRLSAEVIRDQALAASGLLVERLGGPSVKPYQPEGLWEDVSVERRYKYEPDAGAGLYRRTMYSYWKRTCPPPALSTFDAPTRETCTIRRARTNTPLQALVLLNDPTYVEGGRKLAEFVLREAPPDDTARLRTMLRRVIGRTPDERESRQLLDLLTTARTTFRGDREQALALLGVGRAPRDEGLEPSETAAWTVVAATALNLDQALTKE